jgi:hypothetical protein
VVELELEAGDFGASGLRNDGRLPMSREIRGTAGFSWKEEGMGFLAGPSSVVGLGTLGWVHEGRLPQSRDIRSGSGSFEEEGGGVSTDEVDSEAPLSGDAATRRRFIRREGKRGHVSVDRTRSPVLVHQARV